MAWFAFAVIFNVIGFAVVVMLARPRRRIGFHRYGRRERRGVR